MAFGQKHIPFFDKVKAVTDTYPPVTLTTQQLAEIAGQVPSTDISGKVDKETGKALLATTEAAKIHSPGSDNQDLSGKSDVGHVHTGTYEPSNSNIQTHVTASHAPSNAVALSTVKADTDIASAISLKHSNSLDHASGSDNQDLSGLVNKETGKSLVADAEITKIHTSGTDQGLDSGGANAVTASQTKTGYIHSQNAHAPSNAQKNSDIIQSEIEAILTGTISSHNHTAAAFNSPYRTLLDSTGSHIAAKVAGTYGIPQGNPLAVTGTGTLYALNVLYIDSADYPTVDGKTAKLRVRCVIECNDVAPFSGTFTIGLHPVTRPGTSGGAGVCIYTIGSAIAGSTVVGTNLAADSQNNLVGADFALPANGFYVLAVVTSATMATSSHVHISACLQLHYS